MSLIQRTVVLTGSLAGKTINLRGEYPFVDGELTLTGTYDDVNAIARHLERNFSAYLKGDERLTTAMEVLNGQRNIQTETATDTHGKDAIHSDIQPNGSGIGEKGSAVSDESAGVDAGGAGVLSIGDGFTPQLDNEPVPLGNAKLTRAIHGLDPKNDAHWIASGKPALAAVEKAYGSSGLTRADVEAAAPGFIRPAH